MSCPIYPITKNTLLSNCKKSNSRVKTPRTSIYLLSTTQMWAGKKVGPKFFQAFPYVESQKTQGYNHRPIVYGRPIYGYNTK